ncbi:MAG: phosphoadenosine phosphosulfate reductase family protein [Magnetococcales bacterium]|nr:phosphoadenosine phosphosulfate reductase family protein [Magnetococcales bacterium]
MTMNVIYVLNVSGGKDSTAMLLWAMERDMTFLPVFADTGNEHRITLEYIDRLPEMTGCPEIVRVRSDFAEAFQGRRRRLPDKWRKDGVPQDRIDEALSNLHPSGNPFLDLCVLKGRFPSTRARFCSQILKHEAIHEYVILPWLDRGWETVSMLGIRAEESPSRAGMLRIEDLGDGRWVFRPLLDWTVGDVFAIHRRHGVDPNPLYRLGCSRVGCMPCIHESKAGIRNIAQRFPDDISRIEKWEKRVGCVSKRGASTFFAVNKVPGHHQGDTTLPIPPIRDVVRWSMTARGGRQLDLFATEKTGDCMSLYGLCE